MNIVISGSGSGGHIYPSISLYQQFKRKHNITVIAFKNIDKKILDLNNITYEYIDDNLSSLQKIKKIKKVFKEKRIEKSITFGGKNSIFINIVSKLNHVDNYIFEQNAIMGKANKINYILCKKVFTNFKLSLKKEINVGNPNAFNIKKNNQLKLFDEKKVTLLFTMGSLGSSSVNKIIEQYIKNNNEYNIIYISGNNVTSKIKNSKNIKVYQFYNPLSELIAISDIVISRAGASTLSEIIALNKPSIIIPSPYVANNHQQKNAMHINKKGACEIILESNLSYSSLSNKIRNLSNNKTYYENMKKAIKKISSKNNFDIIEREIFNENIQ